MAKNKLTSTIKKAVPVKIVSDDPVNNKKGIDKWEAQDALRTIQRAEEIKSNKPLMKAVKAEAKSQMKAMERVCKPSGR